MSYQRRILHVDVNSAFLSWSAVKRLREGDSLDLRTVPSAVGGDAEKRHGIILAKSIPAKKYGVQTAEPLREALRKCPKLIVVPGDYKFYAQMSNAMMDIVRQYAPVVEQYSIDECFLDYTGMGPLAGDAVRAAERLRAEIRQKLGFTVSIGVAPNKLLAKMAGELRKPDAVSTLFYDEIAQKMWPLPVRELFMVGPATERRLLLCGIRTIGDLARTAPDDLRYHFKSHGVTIWRYANGMDDSVVLPNALTPPKSYSQSTTLPRDLTDMQDARVTFFKLCDSLGTRMRADGQSCREITVSLRTGDLRRRTHQSRLGQPTDVTRELYAQTMRLFEQTWAREPLRSIGVAFSGLAPAAFAGCTLFDDQARAAQVRLDATTDRLRARFGPRAVVRALALCGERIEHLDRFAPGSDAPHTRVHF